MRGKILLVAIIFLVAITGSFTVGYQLGGSCIDWGMIEAIATAMGTIVTIIAVLYAIDEYHLKTSSRIKVTVKYKVKTIVTSGVSEICLEIACINKGLNPLTIERVGFLIKKSPVFVTEDFLNHAPENFENKIPMTVMPSKRGCLRLTEKFSKNS